MLRRKPKYHTMPLGGECLPGGIFLPQEKNG